MSILNPFSNPSTTGESLDVYSTEETRIGTWIDGKPIYRKTIDGEIANAAAVWSLIPGTDTMAIEAIIHVYGYVKAADRSGLIYIPNADSYCKLATGGLYFSSSVNQSNTKLVLTIEYTKTTDQPA